MIYVSFDVADTSVNVWHRVSGEITENAAPVSLGDYPSWASHNDRDLIVTIRNRFYYLDGNRAVLPAGSIRSCATIGAGERPLVSKDGTRITTFAHGRIVVRSLLDCEYVFDTGIEGAKADFSWDGRYIAFHVPRAGTVGYEIQVVDLEKRTVRALAGLEGSGLFPSWTQDGRLVFQYDGPDYRGFVSASNVLSVQSRPLATPTTVALSRIVWSDVFPETPQPATKLAVVLVWGPWSAHAPLALQAFEHVYDSLRMSTADVAIAMAVEPGSREVDAERMLRDYGIGLPRIGIAPVGLAQAHAQNQNPTSLLFRDGELVARQLGAQSFDELCAWIGAARGSALPE